MSAYYVLCTTRYLPFIVKILTRRRFCVTLTDKEQTGRWAQKSKNVAHGPTARKTWRQSSHPAWLYLRHLFSTSPGHLKASKWPQG